MKRLFPLLAVVWCAAFVSVATATGQQKPATQGFKIPATAKQEKNPLTVNEAVLAGGKTLFAKNCSRCHGPEAKGDGPDADHHHADHMNLTRAAGAAQNPDGVVFYKIWFGSTKPKMPAFGEELTREQAWAIVAYVQTLRAKK